MEQTEKTQLPYFDTAKCGTIVYIKTATGKVGHLSGYKTLVHDIKKKDGEIYSLRLKITQTFRLDEGYSIITDERYMTVRRGSVLQGGYELFNSRLEFTMSMQQNINNQVKILHQSFLETENFT